MCYFDNRQRSFNYYIDNSNQYRMRRDFSRLFELIQLQESIPVLDIQITVSVIVNKI